MYSTAPFLFFYYFLIFQPKDKPPLREVSKYGVFSAPYFPVFGLNTLLYSVNLRIHSEYKKIRTRKNSVFRHFSRSALDTGHRLDICNTFNRQPARLLNMLCTINFLSFIQNPEGIEGDSYLVSI